MTLIMMLGAALAGPCDKPSTLSDLSGRLDAARDSLASGDPAALNADLAFARLAAQCLRKPVSIDLAARFHRLVGIGCQALDQSETATGHFRASQALDPAGSLPVYPADHPLQRTLRESFTPQPTRLRLPSNVTEVTIDGRATTDIDLATAHFLQYRLNDDPQLSWLETPIGALPPWAPPQPEKTRGTKLLVAGGAVLAASVGLTTANLLSARSFDSTTGSVDDLRSTKNRTNVLGGLAIGTGGVGGGLLAAGIIVR